MAEPVLEARGLTRYFGGLAAVDGVSLDLREGEIHAVIGPNGAGKTTLVNLLSGELAPTAGSIRFAGREIAGLSAPTIARRGIARSYQRINVFPDFSAFENCRLAAQSRLDASWRLFAPARRRADLAAQAERVLALVALEAPQRAAAALSHGERRQLEIAMTLATAPLVLLLDEPLAGMGAEESRRMTALIAGLAADHAVLLVEHDVDAVLSVAHVLTVMVEGKVLDTGAPDKVRANPEVQRAYLGEPEAA
jgi:branched-chain amino acid transport system ATP-binding protein